MAAGRKAEVGVIDKAGWANPAMIIVFLMIYSQIQRQLIEAGDPKQLFPYAVTPGKRKNRDKISSLQSLINRGFAITLLNLQFRTHREADDPVGHNYLNNIYYIQRQR